LILKITIVLRDMMIYATFYGIFLEMIVVPNVVLQTLIGHL
jgi:hypothetical protein